MINKEKITKLDIYDIKGNRVLTTKNFSFPRDFFKVKGYELVSVKGNDLPVLHKTDILSVIFEYLNGTRVKCDAKVDISTEFQLNFHVGDGEVLEERRRSFKVTTNEPAIITVIYRGDEEMVLDQPDQATILNINLTGILLKTSVDVQVGDILNITFMKEPVSLRTEILRVQLDNDGNTIGYGCQFLDVSHAMEDKIAKHLLDCQIAERDRLRNGKR